MELQIFYGMLCAVVFFLLGFDSKDSSLRLNVLGFTTLAMVAGLASIAESGQNMTYYIVMSALSLIFFAFGLVLRRGIDEVDAAIS